MALDSTTPDQAAQQIQAAAPVQTPALAAVSAPVTPTPQAAPQQGPSVQNAPTSSTPVPAPHTMFKTFLQTLGGGEMRPQYDAQGRPVTDDQGNVVMAPASKKTLGMSILAGALAGLAQGFTEGPRYGGKGVGYVGPNVGASPAFCNSLRVNCSSVRA